jgi:hypothetical protein
VFAPEHAQRLCQTTPCGHIGSVVIQVDADVAPTHDTAHVSLGIGCDQGLGQRRRPFSCHSRMQAHALAVHGVGLEAVKHGRKSNLQNGNNLAIDSFSKGNNWTALISNSC